MPPVDSAAPLYRALALSYRLGGEEEAWRVVNERITEATVMVERLDYVARRLEVPLPRRLRELGERVEASVAGKDIKGAIMAVSELAEWVREVGPRVEYLWIVSGSLRAAVVLANLALWLYLAFLSDVTGPQNVLASLTILALMASLGAGILFPFHSSVYPLSIALVANMFFAGLYIRSDFYLEEALAALGVAVVTAASIIHSSVARGAAARLLGAK